MEHISQLYELTPIQNKALELNPNLKGTIDTFNTMKHCNCCKRHYCNKPHDINDDRTPTGYPENDSRNYTGYYGEGIDEDILEFAAIYKDSPKPVIDQFTLDNCTECKCACRQDMRNIVRSHISSLHSM
jgi:hypothetical protein